MLGGDLNVAHLVADIEGDAAPKGPGFLPEERAVFDALASAGWVDVVRAHRGDELGPFTWRSTTRGWRIDHLWASPASALRASTVTLGPRKPASDHAMLVAYLVAGEGASALRSMASPEL